MKINELSTILSQQGIRLTRQRGQNFLLDSSMLSRLADITVENSMSSIIEVGAGIGNWTMELAKRARKVYALEVDRKVYGVLCQQVGTMDHVVPMHEDVLRFDFKEFFLQRKGEQFILAGNLPYQLASEILFLWVRLYRELQDPPFRSAFCMVQREVGERMCAQADTRSYGRLAALLQYYCAVRLEKRVSAECFYPRPKVQSSFLSLKFGEGVRQSAAEDAWFETLVKAAFLKRRKQLRNALAEIQLPGEASRTAWAEAMEEAGLSPELRGEALSPSDFLTLARVALKREERP